MILEATRNALPWNLALIEKVGKDIKMSWCIQYIIWIGVRGEAGNIDKGSGHWFPSFRS